MLIRHNPSHIMNIIKPYNRDVIDNTASITICVLLKYTVNIS